MGELIDLNSSQWCENIKTTKKRKMLIGHQSEVIYCGETGRQSYNNFAQPRFIDKQRPNQEFDDSGFGQGQDDLNRSNGYTTAQHTHFGEDSQDTISQPVYHPSRPTYHAPHLVQQSYHVDNQSNRTEFNFSYPHQPLHSRPQQQQHQQRLHQNQKNNNWASVFKIRTSIIKIKSIRWRRPDPLLAR